MILQRYAFCFIFVIGLFVFLVLINRWALKQMFYIFSFLMLYQRAWMLSPCPVNLGYPFRVFLPCVSSIYLPMLSTYGTAKKFFCFFCHSVKLRNTLIINGRNVKNVDGLTANSCQPDWKIDFLSGEVCPVYLDCLLCV